MFEKRFIFFKLEKSVHHIKFIFAHGLSKSLGHVFESLQPYAELNYYRGKEMQGSVRIDKNSVVMRIADQRNLEFSVRRNISVMSKKVRQTIA